MSLALPRSTATRALRLAAGVLLFQGAWFACVLAAARGQGAWAAAFAAGAALLLLAGGTDRRADALLVALALATGVVVDTVLARSGLVLYAAPGPFAPLAPAWILGLWALWGVMLREPLRWLHRRPGAAVLLGAVGGPLSYAAAARLGACRFDDPPLALAALALAWAIVTPLHLAVARRLDARSPA